MSIRSAYSRPIAVGIADKQPALLDFARKEAERAGCGLVLVHAYTVPPSAMGSLYGLDIPGAYRDGGGEVLAEAQRYLDRQGLVVPVSLEVVRGYAPSVLESAAQSARVLVIGPDERKPWYIRLFEGRVARHLAEHAACPVIVVPDTWERAADDAPIVVMVDGETSANGPLQYAFETATARDAELQVLHVVAPGENELETEWGAIRRVVDSWFERHPSVRGGSRVVRGDVREIVLGIASQAAMLILGRPHERRLSNALMDSVAQEIIAESGCAVAVVPGDYRG